MLILQIYNRVMVLLRRSAFILLYLVLSASPSRAADLSRVFAFPVPFKPSQGDTNITFTNLPSDAVIKVFTIDGELVKEIRHSDAAGPVGKETWDVTDSGGEPLGSDVFCYVVTSQGQKVAGKLIVAR